MIHGGSVARHRTGAVVRDLESVLTGKTMVLTIHRMIWRRSTRARIGIPPIRRRSRSIGAIEATANNA